MNLPSKRAIRKNGFALVATLLLMILLTVAAVGLLSLSTITLRSTSRGNATAEANANARLALFLAIAQLQKQTGPDTRISAPADILKESATSILANSGWCGVWRSNAARASSFQKGRSDFFEEWLVTTGETKLGMDSVRAAISGESAIMRQAGTTPEVRVPMMTTVNNGRLAWWTDDESAKARADIPLVTPTEEGAKVAVLHSAPRFAPESVPGIVDFKPTEQNSKALVSPAQMAFSAAKWPDTAGRNFTTYSKSVLADVRNGGLKFDLSSLFEQAEGDINDFGNWKNGSDAKTYLYGNSNVALGARWNQMYAYYNLYKGVSFQNDEPRVVLPAKPINWADADSRKDFGDRAGGFHFPRLAKVIYLFSYGTVKNPNPASANEAYSLRLTTDIFVTLWNPFDVRIVFPPNATAYAKFSKSLPLKFDWRIGGVSRSKIGLEEMIPDDVMPNLFINAPFYREGQGSLFTMAPGETVTFSIRDANSTNFYPGAFFDNGVVTDTLLPGEKLYGKSGDKITVGLEPSDSSNAPSNGGQLTSQYLDFWIYDSLEGRPNYEHRGEIIAKSDAQLTTRMPAVPASGSPAVRMSAIENEKQPFAAFIMESKTATESLYPVPAFLTSGISRLSSQVGGSAAEFMNERLEYKIEAVTGFDSDILQVSLPDNSAGPDHGFIGSGRGPGTGQTSFLFSSIPSEPLTSLAQFRHTGTGDGASVIRATGWGEISTPNSPYADQAIGNSYAHPMLPPDKAENGNLLDNRYLGNEALWDKYFLSSVAPKSASRFGAAKTMAESWKEFTAGTSKLINRRFSPWLGSSNADAVGKELFGSAGTGTVGTDTYRKIASHLMFDGGFNVNSTSVDAWQSFLASTRNQSLKRLPVNGSSNGEEVTTSGALFARTNVVLAGSVDEDSSDVTTHYSGYRDLPDDKLRKLAERIVEQVRLRGPFLNVSEFINRRLSSDTSLSLSGALQTAIDDSDLNEAVASAGSNTSGSPGGVAMAFPAASELGGAAGSPGWLMQGDVLDPLGPAVVVRGDTFRVRGYGESRDKSGAILARSWCEAVVQRTPEFMDTAEKPEAFPVVKPLNQNFGRRYQVTSFRWLNNPEG